MSRRQKTVDSSYHEASSDDEYARKHFILPSSDEGEKNDNDSVEDNEFYVPGKKTKKEQKENQPKGRRGRKSKDEKENEEEEKIEYRIQHILGRKALTPAQWRDIGDNRTTRELTKGSVWQQPDEEYYDTSDVPLEKFYIKWSHCSFLHCSWETEKDLLDMVGPSAKIHLKKFRTKEYSGGNELFEDLSKGEYFPFTFLQIERILDVDDPAVDVRTIKWETVPPPPLSRTPIAKPVSKEGEKATEVDLTKENEDMMKVDTDTAEAEEKTKISDQQLEGEEKEVKEEEEDNGNEKEGLEHDSDSAEDEEDIWKFDSSDDEEEVEDEEEDEEEEEEEEDDVEEDDGDEEVEEEEDDDNNNEEEVEEEGESRKSRKARQSKSLASSDEEFDVDIKGKNKSSRATRSSRRNKHLLSDDENDEEKGVVEDDDVSSDEARRNKKKKAQNQKKRKRSQPSKSTSGRKARRVSKKESTNGKKMRQTTLAKSTIDGNNATKKAPVCKRILKNEYLHGQACWVTVKWEGLPYSETSFESLQDIIYANIDYEIALRAFYRREQRIYDEIMHHHKSLSSSKRLDLQGVDTSVLSNPIAPTFPGGTLRDYQWEGVRWMLYNFVQSRNCILADEMGLGKTIQSATLLQMLKRLQSRSGPFLIVAPLSTIVNWQREIAAWTNLDAILYYGSQQDRELIRSFEFKYLNINSAKSQYTRNQQKKNKGKKSNLTLANEYKVEVVITTPETCVAYDENSLGNNNNNNEDGNPGQGRGPRLRRELSKVPWDVIIIDEAHKLKNYDSKLSSTLREEYTFQHCVLLTGTPLQNNTDELWTLLNFVANVDFADREAFLTQFGDLKTTKQLELLHQKIKPYLLRREKEFVEKTVPPKEEIVIEVELTAPQKQYYRAIYEQKTNFLYKQGAKDGPNLTNLAMELRKCCNHPFLIKGALHELSKHFVNETIHNILIKTSGKMTLLDKLLPKLYADGHRVLIFSQFRSMLDIIEDYLHDSGFCYERVDGSIVGKKRQASIDRYMNNSNLFIMLLSTRAGGVGINLTAADTVIIYDSDWNPQNDIQAQARAHRIGQTKPVTVYRLLTRKSYEMVMFRAASIKLGLDYAVMHNLHNTASQLADNNNAVTTTSGRRSTRHTPSTALAGVSTERAEHVSSISKKELENLLKHGAYDIFLEEKDGTSEQESNQFVEASIESILAHSSVFLHKEDASERQCVRGGGGSGSSFAKASFVSSKTGNSEFEQDIAIDDPEFWNKVVCLSVEDQESGIGGKRKCRQIESYKEPTDSLTAIYGKRANAFITDSESESSLVERKKKKKKTEDETIVAVFSIDNLQAILSVLVNNGYGNWEVIRKQSKMYWTSDDLAKACRCLILYLWLTSYVLKESSNEKPAIVDGEKDVSDKPAEPSSPYDINNLSVLFSKFKALKLAMKLFVEHDKLPSSSSSSSKDKKEVMNLDNETLSISLEEALKPTVENDVLVKFITSLFTQTTTSTTEEGTEPEAVAFTIESLTATKVKESYDQMISLSKEASSLRDLLLIAIQSMEEHAIVKALLLADRMEQQQQQTQPEALGKLLARRALSNRSKLQQIEDLFELSLLQQVMTYYEANMNQSNTIEEADKDKLGAEEAPLNKPKVETEASADITGEEAVEAVKPPGHNYLQSVVWEQYAEKLFTSQPISEKENVTLPVWTSKQDVQFIQAMSQFGWPEGKRRLTNILDVLLPSLPNISTSTASNPTDVNNEENNNNQMDVVDEDGAKPVWEPVAGSGTSNSMVTSKFLLQRAKLLAKLCRAAPEDFAINTASSAKSKSAANALAKQANNEKAQRKKQMISLLKTIQRVGYPRSIYTSMTSALVSVDSAFQKKHYLLSYEDLLQEAGITTDVLSVSDVEEMIATTIDVYNRAEEYQSLETIPSISNAAGTLTFEEIQWKLIDCAFEKSDALHHIRWMLSCTSEQDLYEAIKSNCKQTGPHIPPFKRDQTMPVWWTLSHDLTLLTLILQYGLHQWKKLTMDNAVCSPPSDFEMPPKVNGQEWVTVLTPKNAEKRMTALLRGLPSMRSLPLPAPSSSSEAPPGSPQKTRGVTIQNTPAATVKTGKSSMSSWFQGKAATTPATSSTKPTTSAVVTSVATITSPLPTITTSATNGDDEVVVMEKEVNTTTTTAITTDILVVNTPIPEISQPIKPQPLLSQPTTTAVNTIVIDLDLTEEEEVNKKNQNDKQEAQVVAEIAPPSKKEEESKKEVNSEDVVIIVDEPKTATDLPPLSTPKKNKTAEEGNNNNNSINDMTRTTTDTSETSTSAAANTATTPSTPAPSSSTTATNGKTSATKATKTTTTTAAAEKKTPSKKADKKVDKKAEATATAASSSKSILSFFKKG